MAETCEPLHRRVHWRKIRSIYNNIAQHEGLDISKYNLESIVCYECCGKELKGKNVSYNTENNFSPWVLENNYEIFEAPSVQNTKHNITGEFLVLARNKDYDYWILAKMKHTINKAKTKQTGRVAEFVRFNIYRKIFSPIN